MKRTTFIMLGVALLLIIASEPGTACPVCFGETESNSEEGLVAAIWLLLGVTGTVLGLISALFLQFRRRMRMLRSSHESSPTPNVTTSGEAR